MRRLIEDKLQTVAKKNWLKERVPDKEMIERWKERMEEDTDYEGESRLIDYSDFGDLSSIILKGDNWKCCFESVFGNKMQFEAKMVELQPIRKRIGHSRTLSDEDNDTLRLYSQKILRSIEKSAEKE